jgi:hypothetical protein
VNHLERDQNSGRQQTTLRIGELAEVDWKANDGSLGFVAHFLQSRSRIQLFLKQLAAHTLVTIVILFHQRGLDIVYLGGRKLPRIFPQLDVSIRFCNTLNVCPSGTLARKLQP